MKISFADASPMAALNVYVSAVTEEEHADFMERLTAYGMSQSEFIRQAITGATKSEAKRS